MSLIRNEYATRQGFLGVLLSALLALALFDPSTVTAQEVKQIKLTEKHIQSFMAAYEDMAKVYDDANSDKPDAKVEAQAAAVAKKNGFATLAQYEGVLVNITMIMSGIDSQTKKFTEPPEQIKNEIAALKADKSVPEADKNGPSAARGGAQERKAHSVQGKHRTGAKVLRPARADHARGKIRSCDPRIRNDTSANTALIKPVGFTTDRSARRSSRSSPPPCRRAAR